MKWWNVYEVPDARWGKWRIGPLTLYAQAKPREWVLGWELVGSPTDDSLSSEIPSASEPDRERCALSRHVVSYKRPRLRLTPRLGDRPVIVQPELPLFLSAGEKIVLFVTTVVWVAVAAENGEQLLEVPAMRPSDTWFGPDTREGELCYSSRTRARTDAGSLGAWPHRATTPIEIRNEGSDTLRLEQLRVPIPALALYEDARGQLWTDTVSFARDRGDSQAALTVPRKSAHLPAGASRLAQPRVPVEAGTIVRAFSRLLG